MIKKKINILNTVFYILIILGTLLLLINPKIVIDYIKNAVNLCFNILIPSIFPLLVFSSLFIETGLANDIGKLFNKIIKPIFNLNGSCAIAIILGVIAGYPIGAKIALDLYNNGNCNKSEAERILAFCNNCSPSFIIGGIGIAIFSDYKIGAILYFSQIVASIIVGIAFGHLWKDNLSNNSLNNIKFERKSIVNSLVVSVKSAAINMAYICGFVCFFSVVIGLINGYMIFDNISVFLSSFLPVSSIYIKQFFIGFVELANGINASTTIPSAMQLFIIAIILGWSGLSVHFQVFAILSNSKLNKKAYIIGKTAQGLLSAFITIIFFYIFN